MKILLLGASGQLGSSLYNYLKIKAEVVHGTSRDGRLGLIRFNPFSENWVFPEQNYDILINCIGAIREEPGNSFERTHLGVSEQIIKNRFRIGNPRIIQISVLGASAFSPIHFLRSKAQADEYLLSHPDTIIVRPSIICSPGTLLTKKLRNAGRVSRLLLNRLYVPEGFAYHKIQPILVEDLAKIIWKICLSENAEPILDITGPETWSYGDLLYIANKKIRLSPIKHSITDKIAGFVNNLFPDILTLDQYKLLFTDSTADPGTATSLLGRPPKSTLSFWQRELR